MGAPVSEKEEARMMQLRKDGLTFEIIGRRMDRPARTVSRVIKRLQAEAQPTS